MLSSLFPENEAETTLFAKYKHMQQFVLVLFFFFLQKECNRRMLCNEWTANITGSNEESESESRNDGEHQRDKYSCVPRKLTETCKVKLGESDRINEAR